MTPKNIQTDEQLFTLAEEWRMIKNYEGLYEVSNYGNVRSLDRIVTTRRDKRFYKGRIIKPCTENNGRSFITRLCKTGVIKIIKVHRLVAIHFIPNPENKREVNHIDGNSKNNHVSNLEWCTASENMYHAYRVLGRKSAMKGITGALNKMSKPLFVTHIKTGVQIKFPSLTSACEATNSSISKATCVCTGKRKTHNGYFFKYISNE